MKNHPKATAGTALVTVLAVVATLAILSLCALNYTSSIALNVERSNGYRRACDMGDGALEYAFAYWRETCRRQSNISRPGADFADIPLPTASMFPQVENFHAQRGPNTDPEQPATIANFKIEAVDPQYNTVDQTATPPTGTGMSVGTRTTYYRASADVSVPTMGKPLVVPMRRVFEKQILAPWNYALFFIDDLEIQPGPALNVTGWVHSNGRVFTGHSSLTFGSKMSFGDNWIIGFKPGDSSHNGETAQPPQVPANLPPTREQGQEPYGLEAGRDFNTVDANQNNDSYREIVEQKSGEGPDPFTDTTDPEHPREMRYYDQADIKVLIGANGVVTIKDGTNSVVNEASTDNAKKLYDLISSAVTTGQTIQDHREAAQVKLSTLDISKLYEAFKAGGPMAGLPFNGVVYISDTTAASAPINERRGIRLLNGKSIPAGGLTIASDNAVYIQGDFNTGATASLQPPSNFTGAQNDPTRPTVAGYNREPCAVAADAVMILSNNWSDANSASTLSSRVATNTTVNTAIISGIVPTAAGNYSGGAENFPRFLEEWGSSRTFTYYGSMVQLYKSKYHTGVWGKSNVYGAPRRNWFFDNKFYVNPPPGTLDLVLYKKGRWFTQ